MNKAYFVKQPRRVEDLQISHLISDKRAYKIVKEVTLTVIDYENFITDMRADRQFIKDASVLCADEAVVKCLLVRRRGNTDGILVVPNAPDYSEYVKLAAYVAAVN